MAAEATFDVVVIGRCTMDFSVRFRDIAEIELRDDVWIEAAGFTTMGGGPGATAALVMARLGLRVAFVGRVGDDAALPRSAASWTPTASTRVVWRSIRASRRGWRSCSSTSRPARAAS